MPGQPQTFSGLWRMAAAIVVIAAAFQLLRILLRLRRPRTYARLCRELDLHACPPEPAKGFPELNPVTQHIQGTHAGYECRIFENVSDVVEPGAPTYSQTQILLTKPNWILPAFTIEPRSMATNLRAKIENNKGLFFPRDEAFTKACFVDSHDETAVRSVLVAEATRHLRGNHDIHVDCRENALLFYKSDTLLSASATKRLVEQAIRFADGLATGQDGPKGTEA
jgi:hypothetical protein